MKPCISCVALAAVAIITAGQFVSAGDKAGKLAVGAPAPDFQLKDQDGKTVSLSEFKDKVVVLEWFNDECPFVVKQYKAGDMNKTADAYEAKQVVWLAINSTNGKGVDHNKKIAADWKIERPVLDDSAGTVGKQYGARTTPHMFVVNKGTVVYAGAIDSKRSTEQADIATSENYVAKALDEVLAGKPVSTPQTEPYGCGVKYAN
jgi:peroxiredoxin